MTYFSDHQLQGRQSCTPVERGGDRGKYNTPPRYQAEVYLARLAVPVFRGELLLAVSIPAWSHVPSYSRSCRRRVFHFLQPFNARVSPVYTPCTSASAAPA